MTDRIAVKAHQQTKDYLLCAECEDRFNRNGEKYATSLMRTPKGFKLLDRLNVAPTVSFRIDGTAFSGSDIGIDMDQLAYFALSIFWRAGAHVWKSKYTVKEDYSIDLGEYLEPIRKFLLGGLFPRNMSVMVTTAKDYLSQYFAYAPAPTRGIPVIGFAFLTCGIHFALFLGKPLLPTYQRFCCVRSPRRLLFMRDISAQSMHAAGRLYELGRPAGNMKG